MSARKNHKTLLEIEKYWKDARNFVIARTSDPRDPAWFAFEFGDDAHRQWEKYFSWRLGFMPAGINYLKQGKINEFLVPCERPQDFDPGYSPKIAPAYSSSH